MWRTNPQGFRPFDPVYRKDANEINANAKIMLLIYIAYYRYWIFAALFINSTSLCQYSLRYCFNIKWFIKNLMFLGQFRVILIVILLFRTHYEEILIEFTLSN